MQLGFAVRHGWRGLGQHDHVRFSEPLAEILSDVSDAIRLEAKEPLYSPLRARETFEYLFRVDKRPVVLYDTDCWFCTGGMSVAMTDGGDTVSLRFQAMAGVSGRRLLVYCGREPDDTSSLLAIHADGTWLADAEAALFIAERLEDQLLKRVARGLQYIPQPALEMAFQAISKNRHRLGGQGGQGGPQPPPIRVSDLKWEALSAEQQGRVLEAWARLDGEGAGAIDASGLPALRESLGAELTDEDVREAFPALDANLRGTVSYEEYRGLAAKLLLAERAS